MAARRIEASGIRLAEGQHRDPVMHGLVKKEGDSVPQKYTCPDPREGKTVGLIRPGSEYGFIFDSSIPPDDATHPENRTDHPFVWFTDDADLRWEIDDNLHLKPCRPTSRWRYALGRLPGRRTGYPKT